MQRGPVAHVGKRLTPVELDEQMSMVRSSEPGPGCEIQNQDYPTRTDHQSIPAPPQIPALACLI
jgi:hypothetical protein